MDAHRPNRPDDLDEVYRLLANDPQGQMVDRAGLSDEDIEQTEQVMAAMGRLREAERRLAAVALQEMQLNDTDLRALHFLIVRANSGQLVTPGDISAHLGISSASTTKLLDRLEAAGHLTRQPHPADRRALSITISPTTREATMRTVGRQHARRFDVAAHLAPSERALIIRFLDEMAEQLVAGSDEWGTDAPARQG